MNKQTDEQESNNSRMEFIDFTPTTDEYVRDEISLPASPNNASNDDDDDDRGFEKGNIMMIAAGTAVGGGGGGKTTAAIDQSTKKIDDEFEVFANFMAAELRLIEDVAVARSLKRKILLYFANSMVDVDKEMVKL